MLAEFARPDHPEEVVGRAAWTGRSAEVDAHDEDVRAAVERIFRPTSLLVDSPRLRSAGATGPELLAPGSLRWFIAAAESRSKEENLELRLRPQTGRTIGWDPAGAYRTFSDSVERRERGKGDAVGSGPAGSHA